MECKLRIVSVELTIEEMAFLHTIMDMSELTDNANVKGLLLSISEKFRVIGDTMNEQEYEYLNGRLKLMFTQNEN